MIVIKTGQLRLRKPIDETLVAQSIEMLNVIFNLPAFGEALSKETFVATNRPGFGNGETIPGLDVYNDFISKGTLIVNLEIKKGGFFSVGWFRNVAFGTLGETNVTGSTIVTYNSWLKKLTPRDRLIYYTTHIGHELFHTNYFGYIHDPAVANADFKGERDVTYKVDEIIEKLINENYPNITAN